MVCLQGSETHNIRLLINCPFRLSQNGLDLRSSKDLSCVALKIKDNLNSDLDCLLRFIYYSSLILFRSKMMQWTLHGIS